MPATLTSGAVGLYWERLDSVGRSIQRQAPPHPPGKAGERTVQLFHALHALHDSEQARSPEDVAATLDKWVALEEEVAHILHENTEPLVTASPSWADVVALSSPLRVLHRLATKANINVAESLLELSPVPRRRGLSLASGLSALSRSSSAAGLDTEPPHEPQQRGGGGGAAEAESGDDDLLGPHLEAVRETLLAKACLGLLHWWLMVLLDLCFSAEAAAKFWHEQTYATQGSNPGLAD